MPNRSKQKGDRHEREIVNQAIASGIPAKRAPGSNGENIGEHKEVDVKLGGYRVQCKRRARVAEYIKPSEHVDIQIIREDNGTSLVVIEWFNFLDLLKAAGLSDEARDNKMG
tara:strand:- start:911 stop:1246 length:336 start_codon:yes stop_codon:yes gene_type:complete